MLPCHCSEQSSKTMNLYMRENLSCILTRTLVREDDSGRERSKCYLDFGQYSHTLYQVRIRYARYKKI